MEISKLLHDLRNNITYNEYGIATITREAINSLADVIEQQEKTITEKQQHIEGLEKINEDLEERIAIMSEGKSAAEVHLGQVPAAEVQELCEQMCDKCSLRSAMQQQQEGW